MALEVGAVGIAEGCGADVVYEARGASREEEGGGLVVVIFLDVFGQDVDECVCDSREDDSFHVAGVDGLLDLPLEPGRQLFVGEVLDGHKDAISEGERCLIRYLLPLAGCYHGR